MATFGTFSGGGLGFGLAFTLRDAFSGPSSRIQNSYNQLESATDRLADRVNQNLSKISGGVAMVVTGLGLLAPLKKAMDVRSEFESYELQLTTLLKSAEKARSVLSKIKQDAKDNPVFGTQELVGVNAGLISTMEVDPGRARDIVNNLATAIAATGGGNNELARMGYNLQQIAATGKATAMDIKQFGQAGIPIFTLLAESTGKSVDEIKEMEITLPMLEKAFEKAAAKGGMFEGALESAASGTKGLQAALEDNVIFTMEAVGKMIEPVTKRIRKGLNGILDWVQAFVSSPVGKVISMIFIAIVGIAALSLVVVGLIMVLEGLVAVVGTLLIEILPIILAVVIFIAALWGLYEAIQSNNPLILALGGVLMVALGPIGWIAAAIMVVIRALNEFDTWLEAVANGQYYWEDSPVWLFFVRLGGIIRAVIEIFQSASKEGFTMSENLYNALDNIGIADLAISIGTWIVRIKAFLGGIKEGFMGAWNAAKEFLEGMYNKFAPVLGMTESWEDFIGSNTSDVEKWAEYGRRAGEIIFYAIAAIITILAVLAVAWVIAMLPQILMSILVIAAIVAIIWIVYKLYQIWDWWIDFVIGAVDMIVGKIIELKDTVVGFAQDMYDAGVNWVANLWEGIKSKWSGMSDWVAEKWAKIKKFVGLADDDDGKPSPVGTTGGGGGGYAAAPWGPIAPANEDLFSTEGKRVARLNTASAGSNNFSTTHQNNNYGGPVTVPIYLDSDKIGESVLDAQTLNEARA